MSRKHASNSETDIAPPTIRRGRFAVQRTGANDFSQSLRMPPARSEGEAASQLKPKRVRRFSIEAVMTPEVPKLEPLACEIPQCPTTTDRTSVSSVESIASAPASYVPSLSSTQAVFSQHVSSPLAVIGEVPYANQQESNQEIERTVRWVLNDLINFAVYENGGDALAGGLLTPSLPKERRNILQAFETQISLEEQSIAR